MIGRQFGRLTVLEQFYCYTDTNKKYKYYVCECSCGNTKVVLSSNLTSGKTTSCGCYRLERVREVRHLSKNTPTGAKVDLVGKSFGKLTVISPADNVNCTPKNPVGRTAWNCVCECGNAVVRSTGTLNKSDKIAMCNECKGALGREQLRKFRQEHPVSPRFIDYAGRRYGKLLVLCRYSENKNNRTTYIVVCDCGTFKLVSREALDNGHTNSCGCYRREDSRAKMLIMRPTQVGSNNPAWNPELTDEDRIIGRNSTESKQWHKDIKVRDNFTCQLCGNRTSPLNSHHLDSYRAHPLRRVDPTNGETLCTKCHKEFHKKYGHRVTYEWQFHEQYFHNLNQKFINIDNILS